ncbi:YcaO-like family protein [Candidatus Methanoplasma termitum]|uniref:YcaO-like family protein n=1 Tax=Candidatus Methanoplasma termitum TaxID=1577791 RepID=A0A0A7LBH0_9ARCH|nr:YcaO-related McrA-glycine thioamidation protein [Candidatus Methanoplasma termitum]AIZ56500.1 YcaO-like family protein [Candidatus Methanoplasma termitum]MCL2333236.1 YcaO-related McrA-glycine thioamidation protein [Candidatus Methanoplasma sp.]
MILNRCPKYSPGAGIRVVPPEKTLERVLPILPRIGICDPLDITPLDNIGIPVFAVDRPGASKGAVKNYNGKGATPEQAKASAAMEAIERYSAERRDTDEVVYGTLQQAMNVGMTVDPKDLILPLRTLGVYDTAEIAWVLGYELLRGAQIWIPACAVFHPYFPDSDLPLFRYHTNGIASGNTVEEAILHALFELIERDAWSMAEGRGRAFADVVVEEDSVPGKLLRKMEDKGVKIHLKDLTHDIGIPTIGAAADDTVSKDPELLTIGVGTHLNPEIACIRAITEVAQSRTTHKHGVKGNARLLKIANDMGYDKIKSVNSLWYRDLNEKVHLKDMIDLSTPYVLDDIEVVLDRLVQTGFDMVIVSDLTRPETGIPVVRMTVPGLEVSTMDPEREGARLNGMWNE